jgi:hypothetical protein
MLKAITASPIVKKSLLGAAMATSILAGEISANAKSPEHPSTTSVSTNPIPKTKADASSVVAMYQNVNTNLIKRTSPHRELNEKVTNVKQKDVKPENTTKAKWNPILMLPTLIALFYFIGRE